MKKLIILMFLVITANVLGQEDRWVKYGYDEDDNVTMFYDKETIWFKGSSAVIWVKYVYDTPVYNDYFNKSMIIFMSQIEVFCSQRKYQTKEIIYYFSDETTYSQTYESSEKYNTVIPDTKGEMYFKLICN